MKHSDSCLILVVDNDPVSARVAQAMLERLGCEVHIASDPDEAIALCRKQQYHLVLLDWSLDGPGTTRKLRALPYGYVVPVIATSHHSLMECLEAGGNGVLNKPFEMRKMAKLLEEWGCQALQ